MEELKGLHFVTGEKGGVGKSLFTMVLLEYFNNLGIDYKFYDADRSSPDVGLAYGESYDEMVSSLLDTEEYGASTSLKELVTAGKDNQYGKELSNNTPPEEKAHQVYFSEDQRESFRADLLYEEASEGNLVVVNLPAQVELLVNQWLTARSILEESDFPIYYWFVTDGSPESLTLMERSLKQYGDKIEHIIVRNSGLNKSVDDAIIRHPVLKLMRSLKTKMVEMGQLILSDVQMETVKNNKLTFSKAMDREVNIEGLKSLSKTRIKTFLKKSHIEIDRTFVFAIKEEESQATEEPEKKPEQEGLDSPENQEVSNG